MKVKHLARIILISYLLWSLYTSIFITDWNVKEPELIHVFCIVGIVLFFGGCMILLTTFIAENWNRKIF